MSKSKVAAPPRGTGILGGKLGPLINESGNIKMFEAHTIVVMLYIYIVISISCMLERLISNGHLE